MTNKTIGLAFVLILIWVSSSEALSIVHKTASSHPLEATVHPHVWGFDLSHVLVHYPEQDEIHRYQIDQIAQREKFMTKKQSPPEPLLFSTVREKALACTIMLEQSYPRDAFDSDDKDYQDYMLNLHNNEFPNSLKDSNWSSDVHFDGSRKNFADDHAAGVQIVVYTNNETKSAVLAFRGSYSKYDWVQNALWMKDFLVHEMPDVSKEHWRDLGNRVSELPTRDAAANYWRRFYLDMGLWVESFYFYDKLADSSIGKGTAKSQGYYAVSKNMISSLIPELTELGYEVTITGHSLGGALASLSSMWWAQKNAPLQTITFGAFGVRCLADRKNFDLDALVPNYENIINFVDEYDLIPLMDILPGKVCTIPGEIPAKNECEDAYGLGVELVTEDSAKHHFKNCRNATHSIFRFYRAMLNSSLVYENGTTVLGNCPIASGKCPNYKTGDWYIVFITTHALLAFLILVGIGVGIFVIIRLIYLKVKDSDAPIFCCCGPDGCCGYDGPCGPDGWCSEDGCVRRCCRMETI